MNYHTYQQKLSSLYDAVSRGNGFRAKSVDEFLLWKRNVRGVLRGLTGLDWTSNLPVPAVTQVCEEAMDGYTRVKLHIETESGVVMPTFMLRPDGVKSGQKLPVMICTHGHASHGKDAVVGNAISEAHRQIINDFNYEYGVEFVKKGFLVFAPDARGFGERRESYSQQEEHNPHGSCQQLNHMGLPLGKTVTGLWVYDLMRLMDFIVTRTDVLADKIGVAGLSGGGLQALWFGTFDDRLSLVIDSGYFYGYKQSLLELCMNCSCNFVPHLWEHVDMGDLGAMIAPTPFFVETGDSDELNGRDGVANVTSQVDIARAAYRLFGREDNLCHHVFHGPHKWDGTQAIPFAMKHLVSQ